MVNGTPYTGPKVFGVGFHKTGTTSLYTALRLLGLRVSGSVGVDLRLGDLQARAQELCLTRAREVDAVEDMPWPLYFRELDRAFPGSKFVLTVRDMTCWYNSVARHFKDHEPPMHVLIYGAGKANALTHKEHWIATHQAHIEAVKAWFAARPDDLLVLDIGAGDGWEKLCPFLDLPVPQAPFPHSNTSQTRKSLRYRLLRHWHLLRGRPFYPEHAAFL